MAATRLTKAINLRLALLGLPQTAGTAETEAAQVVAPILARQRELRRLLRDTMCPSDARIQAFLDSYLAECGEPVRLPSRTLTLDVPGMARELALPVSGDVFVSDQISSYRLRNGVLHNPKHDRRTTAGVFHISEGGLPISDDKIALPKFAFAELFRRALQPPAESMVLPFTAEEPDPAATFVSLLLRPLVVPEVPGYMSEKRMEVRFIAPGGLVANLDFVESIFGNGGDPFLPENDAALDPAGWTGHTGCVILAPHLVGVTKRELGLPHIDEASDRAKRDGMCWSDEAELYNDGLPFKACARDARGVIVTVIADNYFGYCKKEVKSQISYSANLFGCAEEEHAGGALVFPSYNLGQEFTDDFAGPDFSLEAVVKTNPDRFELQPEGHAIDNQLSNVILVPARTTYSLRDRSVNWDDPLRGRQHIKMLADKTYVGPDGYRVQMVQHAADQTQWSLVGTRPRSTNCHKPATVSGGGKSEISKAITDAIIFGSAYSPDFDADMDAVEAVFTRDFSQIYADPQRNGVDMRPVLSDERSMGSVIKLLSPSSDYCAEHNEWLARIPQHVKELVFVVKRFYRPEWGSDWRSHFSVGRINGRQGINLRLDGEKIAVNMLRVGFEEDGSWRLFGLRHDFNPAVKVQTEDDITASTVVPGFVTGTQESAKIVENCENMLFQRPDDAIHRGYDTQAEADIAQSQTFLSNFEPLDAQAARDMVADAIEFSTFTGPMQELIHQVANSKPGDPGTYFVCSANPRLVDGVPSKNPRYLQRRPDIDNPTATRIADLTEHLARRRPVSEPMRVPVNVVAAGRRNNPPEPGIRPLCAYNPLHYMELPELFLEFISSMTGKSPSTTGAGSEGAMTKGPFNALPMIIDLNAALLSFVLSGHDGWVSCAGYIGPKARIDHDFSLLVPEVFSRMTPSERDPKALIEKGYLEKIPDFEFDGKPVHSSRLGYRMSAKFAIAYFGRIFLHPHEVFTSEMLAPELQDMAIFADSVDNIVSTHERVAKAYFADGTVELACPPLRKLLEIMAHGQTSEGWDLETPEFRALFERESVLGSEWYAARIQAKQDEDVRRMQGGVDALTEFMAIPDNQAAVDRLHIPERLARIEQSLATASAPEYRKQLWGTLGRQVDFGS